MLFVFSNSKKRNSSEQSGREGSETMAEPRNRYEFLKQLAEKKEAGKASFQDLFRYLETKARAKGIPVHGQFELTPICNFNCRMCYVHLTKEQMGEQKLLTVEQWKAIIRQAWEAGMIRASLTGGECLTYPRFKEIYLYLRSLGCEVCVLTNGSLINDEWISFFRENRPISIQVTLYGAGEEAYERVTGQRCFAKVVENLRKMKEADLPVRLAVTPSRYLGEDVFETIRFAKSVDARVSVNSYLIDPREETGRSGQQDDLDLDFYVRILRFLEEDKGKEIREIPADQLPPAGGPNHACDRCGLRCGGGRSAFSVDWKGVIHPCNLLYSVEGYPLRTGFAEAWKQIHQAAKSWPRVPECEGCAYESLCSNCAARMLRFEEPGKQPVALCEQTRYLVQRGAWHIPDCE